MRTVLGGLAEFERDMIRAPMGERCGRTVAIGVHLGCPAKLTMHQKHDALKTLDDRTASQADLARRFNVRRLTPWMTIWPEAFA
jgi:hypothetical protein